VDDQQGKHSEQPEKKTEPKPKPNQTKPNQTKPNQTKPHQTTNAPKVDDATWQRLSAADYSSPAALASLPLTERWVVSSLHQLVDRVTACQEGNDFSEAGQVRVD